MDRTDTAKLTENARMAIWDDDAPQLAKMLAHGLADRLPGGGEEQGKLLSAALTGFRRRGPDFLRMLLEAGFDPEAPDWQGVPPLLQAAGYAMPDAITLLLQAGADPLRVTDSGANAASMVIGGRCCDDCDSRREETKTMVRELGVSLDPFSDHCRDLMRRAGEWPGNGSRIRELLALGIPTEPLRWTPLMMDLVMGNLTAGDIDDAAQSGLDLDHRDAWSRNLFLLAAAVGRADLLEPLMRKGADIRTTGADGMNALHYAARSGHIPVLDWLAAQGLDLESQDSKGRTPLMLAVNHDDEAGAERLLDLGADVEAADFDGGRVVHLASRPEMLSLLIRHGVDVTAPSRCGYQLIHNTIDMEMVELLLDAGADVNAMSGGGSWILKDIAQQGDVEGVATLLRHGADVNLSCGSEGTALFGAVQSDNIKCVEMLREAGAHINAMDSDGWTCLSWVKSLEMAQYLLEQGADPFLCEEYGGSAPINWHEEEIRELFRRFRLSPAGQERWLQGGHHVKDHQGNAGE
ncbi:MAG: hypothetical protein EOP86_21550 [Verrucomicrobiaceae bacterium]|nr:MAG: hypothetical protein EOP86_21550 [Verrucomicrobiaceae bacterium]